MWSLFGMGEPDPPPKPTVGFREQLTADVDDDSATEQADTATSGGTIMSMSEVLSFATKPPVPARPKAAYPGSSKHAFADEDCGAADDSGLSPSAMLAQQQRRMPSSRAVAAAAAGGSSSAAASRGGVLVPYSARKQQQQQQRRRRQPHQQPPPSSGTAGVATPGVSSSSGGGCSSSGGGGASKGGAPLAGGSGARHGLPPSKQMQQEEVLAPLDEEEREALEARVRARSGRFATARPGGYGGYGGYGGVGSGATAGDTARGYSTAPYAKGTQATRRAAPTRASSRRSASGCRR